MKNILILCFACFIFILRANAQDTLYTQNFNSGFATDWSLNTTDLSGDASMDDNYWIINDDYTGGTLFSFFSSIPVLIPTTASEPSGIVGYPNSYYLHILSYAAANNTTYSSSFSSSIPDPILNCNFNADGFSTYFVAKNTPIVTTGYSGVSFSFWWLCQGDAGAYGKVYYRTSSSSTWLPLPGGPATYFGSGTWAHQVVTNVAFDNQSFLEFGFQFTQDASGSDPAFAVDDIRLVGTNAPPVASYTSSSTVTCPDSSITFTSTSTGSIDSIRWAIPGMTIPLPDTTTTITITFPAAGVDTVYLYAYNIGGTDTTKNIITVNPAPHPAITHTTGKHLSVSGSYSGYQWTNGVTPITGATSSAYTYIIGGTYGVVVDSSDGCYGYATITVSTAGVANVNGTDNKFWITQPNNSSLTLNAEQPLTEPVMVNVYDEAGRQMLSGTWDKGAETKQLDASLYPPGVYIIKLSNENTSAALQWVKQ